MQSWKAPLVLCVGGIEQSLTGWWKAQFVSMFIQKNYMSVLSVYVGDKFILKDSFTEGVNAHYAKAMDRFVPKECLKAAFSIQCSIESNRNPRIRFILRAHHSR